jgi:signal transduction histidine kinase
VDAPSRRRPAPGDLLVVGLALVVDLLVWGGDSRLRTGGEAPLWVVPVLSVLVMATLVLRRHRPLPVFGVHYAYGFAGLLLPSYAPFAGLLVALHAVAQQRPRRVAVPALLACALPFAVHTYNAAPAGTADQLLRLVISGAMWTCIVVGVWVFGRTAYAAHRRAALVERLRADESAEAVRAERRRLARDLHDIVAHAVTTMVLHAAGARTLVDPSDERVREALTVIERSGVQAMSELHRLLGLLRADDPDGAPVDPTAQPGVADLPPLVDLARAAGLDVETAVDGTPGALDPSVDLAAYRVVQEALTNAVKHGGRGAAVRIHCAWSPDGLTITVRNTSGWARDEGPTVAGLSSGRGVAGLTERVTLVGGRLEAGPVEGGFVVRAELPLARAGAFGPAGVGR